MFYEPKDGHGLPHNPFLAIVAPRPIGWISSRGDMGDNLAPYSFFNAVAYRPPQVMFATTGFKDSWRNVTATGQFCVNIVGEAQFLQMSQTSASVPADQDEFRLAGLGKDPCRTIDCPRVAGAPAALECRVTQVVTLSGHHNAMVVGEVTGIHLRDDCLVDGRFDVTRFRPVARLGYQDYAIVRDLVALARPDEG
jgi:flavin reductase (DIM6/NTAB) family NADH-FMN oxidoreductase RutF